MYPPVLGLQVIIFMAWDIILLLGVYYIVVKFGTLYWQQRWYIWVATGGGILTAVEGSWSAYQLHRERKSSKPTGADHASAALLAAAHDPVESL
jgi:hypothetical protein